MASSLQTFTQALERATGNAFVSAVTLKPMRMPAYKQYTFTLKQIDGEDFEKHSITRSYCEHVVYEEEKDAILEKLTEKFISEVLRKMLIPKLINPKVYEVV